MCKSEIGAGEVSKEELKQTQFVKDVHIGVFFDEAGFDTAWDYIHSESFQKSNPDYVNFFTKQKQPLGVTKGNPNQKIELIDFSDTDFSYFLRSLSPEMLCDIEDATDRSVSNISVLFSLFNNNDNSNVHKIYINGVGVSAANPVFRTTSSSDSDFGTGDTGIVSRVSKAVRYVEDYVGSLERRSIISSNEVLLHFYVFGFGIGALCARLFSKLLTRDKGDKPLLYEYQFEEYLPPSLINDSKKVVFLEAYDNKTIDFLGLFDTVCSLGRDYLTFDSKDTETAINLLRDIGSAYVSDKVGTAVISTPLIKEILSLLGFSAIISKAIVIFIISIILEKMSELILDSVMEKQYDNLKKELEELNTGWDLSKECNGDRIKQVVHLGAIDEYRQYYPFVSMGAIKKIPTNTVEIMIPGSHADVGGSYSFQNEQEQITINKNINISINSRKDKEQANFYVGSPFSNPAEDDVSLIKPVCGETLEELGWFDVGLFTEEVTPNTRVNPYKRSLQKKYTIKHYRDDENVFSVSRKVQRGYSTIPLAMMMEYCLKCDLDNMFISNIPAEFDYKKRTPELIFLGELIIDKIESEMTEPARYWCIPSDYKSLRLNYLHLSVNDDNLHDVASYELNNYVICRRTYYANSGDKSAFLFDNEGTPIYI